MRKFLFLFVLLAACEENLPSNQTSEQVAGHAAVQPLTFGCQPKAVAEATFSYNILGVPPYCENFPGQTNCYAHPAPWGDNPAWYFILWGQGSSRSQSLDLYYPNNPNPAIYLGHFVCDCSSCVSR